MSELDLVVRAGTVVDGTGSPPRTADVAVTDGLIVEVGKVRGRGRREIDADGAVVAPGFVDIHTHYDGQATWDDRLQPSSWHGVTTVVMGNCGVGFAPARPADRDRLVRLMEGVEDIPGVVLNEGLSWDWESFPEYLDALDRRFYDVDLATQVPHAALRVFAMGERASAFERATAEEIESMARLAAEAIRAGALGFSTSRTLNHKTLAGEVTPSYDAGTNELTAIASAIGRTGTGVLQLVTDFLDPPADFELMDQLLEQSGRPLSLSLIQSRDAPEKYRQVLSWMTSANKREHVVRGQVAVRGIGMILGLECTLNPFMANPEWKKIACGTPREQASVLAAPETKARILQAQTKDKDPNVGGGLRIDRYDAMFELTDPPDYEPSPDRSVASLAARSGRTPEDVAYDMIVANEGRGMIYMPFSNYADGSLDAVREMLGHPHTLPALSDGGAHVGTVCDASFPTTLLQYWVRDRQRNRLELPFAVQRQSRDTARAVGLLDRGQLTPGYKADLNVIDMGALRLHKPEMQYDLPSGGRRLVQRADGYRHTIVSGHETYRDGLETGLLPGRLIRGPRFSAQARE